MKYFKRLLHVAVIAILAVYIFITSTMAIDADCRYEIRASADSLNTAHPFAVDLNNDGLDDIIAIHRPGSATPIQIYYSDGRNLIFDTVLPFPFYATAAQSFDVDDDGDLDVILSSHYEPAQLAVLYNPHISSNPGVFQLDSVSRFVLADSARYVPGILPGHFDSDLSTIEIIVSVASAVLDGCGGICGDESFAHLLLLARYQHTTRTWSLDTLTHDIPSPGTLLNTPNSPLSLTKAELNGDDFADFLVAGGKPDTTSGPSFFEIWWGQSGIQPFSEATSLHVDLGKNIIDLAALSLDADSLPDLILLEREGPVRVSFHTGSATMPYVTFDSLIVNGEFEDLHVDDFDSDGDSDLVFSDLLNSSITLLTNNRTGLPTVQNLLFTQPLSPFWLSSGNITSGSAVDLVIGGKNFTTATGSLIVGDWSDRGDLNADSSIDIADLTLLISIMFILSDPPTNPPCLQDVNCDGSSGDIADLTALVDHLFIVGDPLCL